MESITREISGKSAGLERLAIALSEEQRFLFAWTTGLVLAEIGIVPATRFLCLGCACIVPDDGFNPLSSGRPVCSQCEKPARPHTCLAPVSAKWTAWKSISRNVSPDMSPSFHYETLVDEVRHAFSEKTLKTASGSAFELFLSIGKRRHIQNVVPILGRRWLELHDQGKEIGVQKHICHLLTELCLAPQLPLIAVSVLKRYRVADQKLKCLPDIKVCLKTLLSKKRNALNAGVKAKRTAWTGYRTKCARTVVLLDIAMHQDTCRRKDRLKALSRRLDIASVASHWSTFHRTGRRLDTFAQLSNYRNSLQRTSDRFAACYNRELRKHVAEVLSHCKREPIRATEVLSELLEKRDASTRHIDEQLIKSWTEGRNNPFPMIAARAAEHLALAWVRSWRPAEDCVQDISRLQIEKPKDVRWQRGDISRIAAKDGQEIFYDVKNTCVREAGFSHLRVKHTVSGKTSGVSYIGTLTNGWISQNILKINEIANIPVYLYVAGIYNKHTRKEIAKFAETHTPSVSLGETDLWDVHAGDRQRTRVPGFLFVMPPEAWNPFRDKHLLRRLWDCANADHSLSLMSLFAEDNELKNIPSTTFTAGIDALLMQALDTGRVPWLPKVYLTVLEAFVSKFNAIVNGASPADPEVIWSETRAIFFGNDHRTPLGAWDPSESLYIVVRAFRMLLRRVDGPTGGESLPVIAKIHLNAAGTIIAETGTGERITLVCHCEGKYPPKQPPLQVHRQFCKSWPLVFGNDDGHYPELPPARSCKKCRRLLCNKGHGCPGADPDDSDCLWNEMRNE